MTNVIGRNKSERASANEKTVKSVNETIANAASKPSGTEPTVSARRNKISGRDRRAVAVIDLPPLPPTGSDFVIKVDTIRPCWLSEIEAECGTTTNPEYATRYADLATAHKAMRTASGRISYALRIDIQPSLKSSMTLDQALSKHVQRFAIKASTLQASSQGEFCRYADVIAAFRIWQKFGGGPGLDATQGADAVVEDVSKELSATTPKAKHVLVGALHGMQDIVRGMR